MDEMYQVKLVPISFSASPNGDCLYNACSLALIGDESLSKNLRFLTSIELYRFSEFYAKHPHIESLWKAGGLPKDVKSKDSLMSQCFGENASWAFKKGQGWNDSILIQAEENCNLGTWSPLICLMALTSVIGLTIESVFPDCNQESTQRIFNGSMAPRVKKSWFPASKVTILWSRIGTINNAFGYKANHCVPLVEEAEEMDVESVCVELNNLKQETSPQNRSDAGPSKDVEHPVVKKVKLTTDEKNSKKKPALQQSKLAGFLGVQKQVVEERSIKSERGKPVMETAMVNVKDIGLFYEKVPLLTQEEKYDLCLNVWRPERSYEFPRSNESGAKRAFSFNWFERFPWLAYSKYLDGAFCLPCVLFGRATGHNMQKLDKLFKSPLTYWTSASSKLKDHESKSTLHHFSMLQMDQLMSVMEKRQKPIEEIADSVRHARIRLNREKLKPILETVVFCGRQNIALRGHRDDSTYLEAQHGRNTGNFQELLDFRVNSGDRILEEHFKTAKRNANYRSKTIQNEMISCCGEYISQSIIKEIKESGMFSVLADEGKDVSNKEQMVLVVRFVDSQREIREEFLRFLHCDAGTSGQAISNQILSLVRDLGLDMENCRGQGYDGSGNMAGKHIGAAKLVQNSYPKAIYVHCASHRLNLAVASACQLQTIRNMMGTVKTVADFFNNSPKRQGLLEEQIKELMPQQKHMTLVDVCRTRWVLRIDGLIRFEEIFEPTMKALEIIKLNEDKSWNHDSCKDASALFAACSSFEFIIALVIVRNCLAYTRSATVKLQQLNMDAMKAYQEIDEIKRELLNVREKLQQKHQQWFKEAEDLGSYVGSTSKRPRTCGRQQNRANPPAETDEIYFRRTISAPFLDHLSTELAARFNNDSSIVARGFSIVPSIMRNEDHVDTWRGEFAEFVNAYRDDLPLEKALNAELDRWQSKWSNLPQQELPDRISKTLLCTDPLSYPNIYAALKILGTIPITTCECERSISVLRRLKTYLRGTMKQERMNGLALLHVHRDLELDLEKIVDLFAMKHPRRIEMINVLDSDS